MIYQNELFSERGSASLLEKEEYLTRQLITYIGNKRSLLGFIGKGIEIVAKRLNKRKLDCFDGFSGSGVVARFLKKYSNTLVVNDIEKYSEIINRCYCANESDLDIGYLKEIFRTLAKRLTTEPLRTGFFTEMYAPHDDESIAGGERVFYTKRNAMFLDSARQCIEELPEDVRHFFLAPLLSEASVHANTSGVFKGFYKNTGTGHGQFGGNNKDALTRILGNIELLFPIFSNFDCDLRIHRGDSNEIARCVDEVDVAYLDPPYNQHPYGSNYFILNLLSEYIKPKHTSVVSGIPIDWYRSDYNKPKLAYIALSRLAEDIKAKYLIISFNSEGFIALDDMIALLNKVGKTEVLETKYNTFRGSRNLGKRAIHVKEYLYLVEKR